jgi:GT2 family glycosyltransferase/glycosyltransferase involved in cell wall biosynthesis
MHKPAAAVRAIAFFLPQYHPIPENDAWWGKGFTEWFNVTKARPNFTGHEQPHRPADLGYYDLRVPETRQLQAELARAAGIHGFCYYYYWFAGRRLLHEPIDALLRPDAPDFPYCLCWANENWTRTWDGKSGQVLIGQEHSEEDHRNFIRSLFPHFRNEHYIRVDGRPLLLIYRIDIIPDVQRAVAYWRSECAIAGIEDPYLVAVQSFGIGDPTPHGFDAAVEFPPHGTDLQLNSNRAYQSRMLNPNFKGNIIDIAHVSEQALAQPAPAYTRFRGIMPRWDNTARRQDTGLTFVNSSPEHYENWLARTVAYTCKHLEGDERLVFINAWNEWAEGCHLEPDQDYGHAYLDATRRALATQKLDIDTNPTPAAVAPAVVEAARSATPTTATAVAVPAPEPRLAPEPQPTPEATERTPSAVDQLLSRGLHSLYRRTPIARTTKVALAHWLFSNIPGPFKHTTAYQRWQQAKRLARQQAADVTRMASISATPIAKATAENAAEIHIPSSERPLVSVIVPVYGKVTYSLHCLRSVQECKSRVPFEVIVIDDCSPDNSVELLEKVRGIRLVRNEQNLGFLRTCNKAAQAARGEYLLFLNNDTQVLPGWLDELYDVFVSTAGVGLVGSKLVFADGSLQEAGGVIWNDASGTNYGRGDDPTGPEYNYLRDVDYCSGASIMVPRALFEQLGGFDLTFAPAYYEDTDLAFAVRQMGLRVIYQPFSRVIHFEGITSGTDLTQGVKSYQVVNQKKFLAKWQSVLATHGTSSDPIALQRDRKAQRRALVMDVVTPMPDRDSGSIDTFNYLRMLQALGFKVVFCPNDMQNAGRYTEDLQRLGVECLYRPHLTTLRDHLKQHGGEYDLVMLFRVHESVQHINSVRRLCPKAKVIFNTVDLHFVRERRQAEMENSARLLAQAERTKALEYSVMKQSHATIVISDTERALLQKEWPEIKVAAIPYVREVQGRASAFTERRDLVFVGGFLFDPNIDAMNWFLADIWPLVREKLPNVHLLIVGSRLLEETARVWRRNPGVDIVGYVEQISPIFERCRLSIAPLRFGAGIKGKIGTSLSHGVPCVATPLAAEGMGLVDRENIMLGADPTTFAAAIVEAYQNEALWNRLSEKGLALFEEQYSFERGLERLKTLIDGLLLPR